MRFTTSQSQFLEAFNRVAPAVPSRSTLPILSNILMQLEGNRLRMVATDLEVLILTEIEVQGEKDGGLSVPAKKIGDIARELEGKELQCVMDENLHLIINAGDGSYQVPGISSQDFPTIPEFEHAAEIELQGKKLDSMINRTIFAVSTEELRPALTGVFFQIRPLEVRAVATDGHRLVRIIDQNFQYEGEPRELIIPVKALGMVRRNLPQEGQVKIIIGSSYIMVRLEDATLYSRLIEGKYPHYESVIPQKTESRLIVSTEDLIRAVKRAQIFANPINRQVILHLYPDKIELKAEDIEFGGRGSEVVSANYEGEELDIGYNAGYLLDILRLIETDEVRFDLSGARKAGIVRPIQQKEGEDFLSILMPVRLD